MSSAAKMECLYGVDVGLVPEPLKFFLFDLGFGISQNVRVDPTV